jgi:plastocyanin
MKKIILAGVLVAVVAVVLYIRGTFRADSSPTVQTQVPKNAVVVSMREDNYAPNELTIQKGQTVVFKNDSKDWRWPASNLHPTHDIYPEFDPKEPIATGKTWSFRFDKAGSWGMHDHLAPYITGTITVKP